VPRHDTCANLRSKNRRESRTQNYCCVTTDILQRWSRSDQSEQSEQFVFSFGQYVPLYLNNTRIIDTQYGKTMHHLNQAILINNEGARLLQSGHYLNAVCLIRRAAQAAIKGVIAAEDPLLFSINDKSEPLEQPTMLQVHQETTLPLEPSGHNNDHSRSPNDDAIFMYQHPLVFPIEMHIASLDDYTSTMHMVQCGILFNLALASHLLALGSTSDAAPYTAPLELALELYHSVLEDMDWDCSPFIWNMPKSNTLWQCIILNNLAHLHHELCEFDHSIYCLDCVRELLVQSNCLDELKYIGADDARDIKLNLILPQFSKTAPVA
jgi:hypothetical protein